MPVFSQRQTLGPYVLQKPLDSETSRGCVDEETRIQLQISDQCYCFVSSSTLPTMAPRCTLLLDAWQGCEVERRMQVCSSPQFFMGS